MRTALWTLAGAAWFLATFFVTLRLTFPSDAIADRLRFEVDRGSGGRMSLAVEEVHPWRFGVSGREVKLLSVSRDESTEEVLAMDRARVRVSPLSVLSEPRLRGDLRLGDGRIDFALDLVPVDKRYRARRVELEAGDFPIGSLPPIAETKIEGTGAVDLEVDLDAPDGLPSASGSARLTGRALEITGIGSWGELLAGFDALPVSIDEIDLRVEVTEGKARIVRGVVFSSLANVELSGDITLEPTFSRSRLKLTAVIELAEAAKGYASLLGTPWADGKLHYSISGSLANPRGAPESERAASRRASTPVVDPVEPDGGSEAGSAETIEAARAARERRLERLRDRSTRPGGTDPTRGARPGVAGPPGVVGKDEVVPVDEEPGDEPLEEVAPDEDLLDEGPVEDGPIEEEGEEIPIE